MAENSSIKITSYQIVDGEQIEGINQKVRGSYGIMGGCRYIFYTEEHEDGGYISNRIKIMDSGLEISKKGALNAVIALNAGGTGRCFYETPYGAIDMITDDAAVMIKEDKDLVILEMKYSLMDGNSLVSENIVKIIVKMDNMK